MPFSEEDLAQIKSLFTEQLTEIKREILNEANGAITKRLSAAEQKLLNEQKKAMDQGFEMFRSKLPAEKPADGSGQLNDQFSLQLKTFEAKLAEATAKQEEAERRAKTATEKNRREALRRSTSDALTKLGVKDPIRNRIATGHLIDSEKRIAWESEDDDDNGRLVFVNDNRDPVEFETGLKQWAKTEEAKHFMDASGMRGSGSAPGGGHSIRPPTKEESLARLVFENMQKG
jgi:F0F1-type ATP synthase membrane subunit b/b'